MSRLLRLCLSLPAGAASLALRVLLCLVVLPSAALAQNALSDDRVSLPDGPGSIGGVGENVDVNANMGSSSYRVPIRVPRGQTDEMTPDLALHYASGAGLGVAGIGWTLPLMTVERMISRGLPSYTTSDRFAADGSAELVYVGDAGAARVYRQKYEGAFVRYQWHEVGDGGAGYWTAELPDGSVGTFGATADGTLVPEARVTGPGGETFRYHLVELRDAVGRRMVYRYTKAPADGWPLLSEVQYGFGTGSTPYFVVRMSYEARPDATTNATPGHLIKLTQRLTDIEVLADDDVIRRYALDYEPEVASGGMSRLAGVAEYGRAGGKTPLEHRFSYSRSLSGACEQGCEQPFMVDMGTLQNGVNIATGRAALIDINGDSLPDVVSSDAQGNHRFYVATLATDGRPTFSATAAGAASTMGGTNAKFILGAPAVQLFDINGDGFTDIVDKANGTALCSFGRGDWESEGCATDPTQLPTLADDDDDAASDHTPLHIRFFDYDNDKRVDLIETATPGSTTVYRNGEGGFSSQTVGSLEAQFDEERLELSDVNGDGLQDAVMLVGNGADSLLRYKLHLGFGDWAPASGFTEVTLPGLAATDLDNAVLEDLDGDGLSDVVVVTGQVVRYWRNRSNGAFDEAVAITNDDVDGAIPDRDGTQTVLFADMNGNGTDDVVWVSNDGQVQFLEIFPVRPNLLTRVDNGLGWIRTLTYTTSSAERARDEGTAEAWPYELPLAMQIVKTTDTFVTVSGAEDGSGLHERTELEYHAGYYDPVEKAFRGFEVVDRFTLADDLDSQEPARERLTYDVGKDGAHRHGLLLKRQLFGGAALDEPLVEERSVYADCPVAETGAAGVVWPCLAEMTTIHQERRPEAEWLTVATEYSYDGYGNVIEKSEHGVVHTGSPESPGACGTCADAGDLHSGFCGATCAGDERITTTSFVVPGADTAGAWLLRLPVRETESASEGGDATETVRYYDGPSFVGLDEGKATRGLLSRVMRRVDDATFIPGKRYAYTADGDLEMELNPNGDPSDLSDQARSYEYGENNLRVTKVSIHMGDYDLVQEVSYEPSFKQARQATQFFVVEDGNERTPRNATTYRYDEHGRVSAMVLPGDSEAAPTEAYTYELGDPVTRVITHERRVSGGPADVVTVECLDGRGRAIQRRRRVAEGRWLVDGFNVVNGRGAAVRRYQAYESDSDQCETAPPADVPFYAIRYDALEREIAVVAPDEELYGDASVGTRVYLPLVTEVWDAEDNVAEGPHAGTPMRTLADGLGRAFRVERLLSQTELGIYAFAFDDLGNIARVTDPGGSVHEQRFDLASRMTSVIDPDRGTTTFVYDLNDNAVSITDARGVTAATAYDALNRSVATWDADDEDGTKQRSIYDWDPDCDDCRNTAGGLAATVYPVLDAEGRDELSYDPRGRVVLRRRVLEGIAFETRQEFNGTDDVVKTIYPDGREVVYDYDSSRRMKSIAGIITAATYDSRDHLTSVTRANGTHDTTSYDVLERVSARLLADGVVDVTVTRDRVANVAAVTSEGSGLSHAASYTRDAWYRPTLATLGADDEALTIAYDVMDNITSLISSAGAASPAHQGSYAYDGAGPHAVTSTETRDYAYDDAGHMTARGEHALEWDHLGRLVRSTDAEGRVTRYAYAPDGARVVKESYGGITYYPSPDFVVRDGISNAYVSLNEEPVARLRSDALATTVLPDENADGVVDIADAISAPAALTSRVLRAAARRLLLTGEDEITHLHTDRLGSIVLATDEDGAVRGERVFYPLGEVRAQTAYVDERGFTGQERDEETGLLWFPLRLLDTASGRWSSPDPAFLALSGENCDEWGQSTTAYAYVANNPTDITDPDGLLGKKKYRQGERITKQKKVKKPWKKMTKRERSEVGDRHARQVVNNVSRLAPGAAPIVAVVRVFQVAGVKMRGGGSRLSRLQGVAQALIENDRLRIGLKPRVQTRIGGSSAASKRTAKWDGAGTGKRIEMTMGAMLTVGHHVLRAAIGLPNGLAPTLLGKAQGIVRDEVKLK